MWFWLAHEVHLLSFINSDFFFPFELLWFIPCCSYSCLSLFKNKGMPSGANVHRDRIIWLDVAPGLALARTNTNISHTHDPTRMSYAWAVFSSVSFSFLKTLSFCMSFSYDKWSSLKIGFAWNVFYSRWSLWVLGHRNVFATGSSHCAFHWQSKVYCHSKG